MNGKRFSEEKTRRNGFYLALAVCLVAVGIAAWSTYDAVTSYTDPQSSLSQQEGNSPASSQAQAGISLEEEDGEGHGNSSSRGETSSRPSDDPEAPQGSSAQETAGQVTQETPEPSPAPESQPEQEEPQEQVPATAPLYEISQEMIWPIEGGDSLNAYSAGAPVYSKTMKDWRIHTGLDVAAENESPVLACANGQVKETYTDSMLGNVILVEHGDYLFYYCGLGEDFQVNPGDVVTAGQQLGVVTAVPYEAAEEPHLHLEVRRDGVALDPQAVLDGTL